MKMRMVPVLAATIAIVVLMAPLVGAVPDHHSNRSVGAVYIMSNDPSGNQVIVYSREADGSLTWTGNFATGGLGINGITGTNQGGLVLSNNGKWLFAVNAGSNDVSVFRVGRDGLTLTDRENSGGLVPISVTVNKDVVYVLNNGTATTVGNIAGFHLDDGKLTSITGSVQPLSGLVTTAEISFNPSGKILAVTEKSSSLIDTYTVNHQGVASGPIKNTSSGATPFGFVFDSKGVLLVSEAPGSAASSYSVSSTGTLTTISGSVANGQAAACWLVATDNSRFAFTANAHNHTISTYAIGHNGSLTLIKPVAADTGAADLDMALSNGGHYLYVFVHGSNSIEGFRISHNGGLQLVTTVTGLPTTADGLAAN